MSRGWESKAVEGQQAEREQAAAAGRLVAEQSMDEAARLRVRQGLELQRERILSERTSSPHRRSALSMALADVEEKLSELGWTVHL